MSGHPSPRQKRHCVVVNDVGHYFGSRRNGKNRGEGILKFGDMVSLRGGLEDTFNMLNQAKKMY